MFFGFFLGKDQLFLLLWVFLAFFLLKDAKKIFSPFSRCETFRNGKAKLGPGVDHHLIYLKRMTSWFSAGGKYMIDGFEVDNVGVFSFRLLMGCGLNQKVLRLCM